MLPSLGDITNLKADDYAWEGKYDGFRLLFRCTDGRLHLQSRSGRDVTHEFPSLNPLRHNVLLDGEVVGLTDDGVPSFNAIQNRMTTKRVEFWAFDVLELRGVSLARSPYRDRRRVLEALGVESGIVVPDLLTGTAQDALDRSREMQLEGVVAKRWDSTYRQGRAPTWVKHKHWHSIDAVVGGWKVGNGRRDGGIGALLLGIPTASGKLRFIGRVGTGFTDAELEKLAAILQPLHTGTDPFVELSRHDRQGVTFVEPVLVGEAQYQEMSADGKLRHPSWRGLRPDKTVLEVI
jgi:bifunctional non-homologous end joining protein LigD